MMYSHDTYGLGHIRRTMAIANHLRDSQINILILTGSPIVGRYAFPDRVDFVRIPGMIKKTNEEYLPLSIKIDSRHALSIRKEIITATAKSFKPNLFIVDKEPLGLKKEVLPTLKWFRRKLPDTHTILGLRDIMDDRQTIRKDWKKKKIYEILEKYYTEIWVYGIQKFYDPIREYEIPESVSRKIHFTGYIPRKTPNKKTVRKVRREQGLKDGEKLVVVTTGGGGDGYPLMDAFLAMLEDEIASPPFKSVLITGPFMPKSERKKINDRARRFNIKTYRFYRLMENIQASADLVVSMGGYNTVCEILTPGTPALLVPREVPRKEQLIRAQVLQNHNLVEYIPWHLCAPEIMRRKVIGLLENAKPYREAVARFQLTGLDVIQQRLRAFMNEQDRTVKINRGQGLGARDQGSGVGDRESGIGGQVSGARNRGPGIGSNQWHRKVIKI
jgi:predicted glycosyltransferase